jgi:diguanylate cyclase
MVGRQVGQAVRNGLLFERTQEETLTDALTGLPNTRYMFVAVEQALAHARETGEPLSILMMDIDGFAGINEEHGYPAGDRFLIGVSKLIRTLMRDRDTCVRYSGDEFVAVLPGVAREEATQIADRIRRSIDSFSSDVKPGVKARATMSVGHATFALDGERFEDIIMAADERLSADKAARRAASLADGATLIPFRTSGSTRSNN